MQMFLVKVKGHLVEGVISHNYFKVCFIFNKIPSGSPYYILVFVFIWGNNKSPHPSKLVSNNKVSNMNVCY